MKRVRRKREGNPKSLGIALGFLAVASICFGFDLLHFGHHLHHDPSLLRLPGVLAKLIWKWTLLLTSLTLLVFSPRLLLLLMGFFFVLGRTSIGERAWAGSADCERAKEFMNESGIARDAKEDFLGRLKIKPPRTSFPPEMDQVTWWGTFKPFEFWQNPELSATWLDPRGAVIERQSFRGGPCQLAKTTLSVEKLPRKRLKAGMWRVLVSCQNVIIDNHPFAVVGSPGSFVDGKSNDDSGMMIWGGDLKDSPTKERQR